MTESGWKPPTSLAAPGVQSRDPLVVQVHVLAGDVLLVHVSGGIDGSAAPELHRRFDEVAALGRSQPHVLLDLSKVTFLDHAGLDALLLLQERVRAVSGSIELLAPSPAVVRLLHEAEIDGQSHMTSSQDESPID